MTFGLKQERASRIGIVGSVDRGVCTADARLQSREQRGHRPTCGQITTLPVGHHPVYHPCAGRQPVYHPCRGKKGCSKRRTFAAGPQHDYRLVGV